MPFDVYSRAGADAAFATAAQGELADTATQPGDLGTAAAADVADLATAAQGVKADTAVQPAALPDPALSSALAPLVAALQSGADTSVLLLGDSTGNDSDEWFYIFGQWLAAQFPEYTVEYRPWNNTTKAYGRPTILQTGPLGTQYAYLAGSLNDLCQAQSTALTNGDLDLRVKFAADDWTPAASGLVLSRFGAGGDRLLRFGLGAGGNLTFDWTTDGSTLQTMAPSAVATLTDGVAAWVRVTLDTDNGSGQHEIKFYTSTNDAASWTQLGSTITRAGTTSIFTGGTGMWEIGGRGGSAELLAGKWYEVEVRNGIGDAFPLLLAPQSNAWYPIGSDTPVTRNGSSTLTLLNGSITGGSIPTNFSPQVAGMSPPGRHAVTFISTGHNEGTVVGAPWKSLYSTFASAIAARTLCPVVAIAQNPRTAPQAGMTIYAHRQRCGDLAAWSQYGAGRGHLNVYQAFMDDGRAMSLLVNTDGIHPTAAGSQLWADTLAAAVTPLL